VLNSVLATKDKIKLVSADIWQEYHTGIKIKEMTSEKIRGVHYQLKCQILQKWLDCLDTVEEAVLQRIF
jgi:hypothetical protein